MKKLSGLGLLSLLTILGLTVNAFGQSEALWKSALLWVLKHPIIFL